jgi:hypothetical protein
MTNPGGRTPWWRPRRKDGGTATPDDNQDDIPDNNTDDKTKWQKQHTPDGNSDENSDNNPDAIYVVICGCGHLLLAS